MEGGDNDEESIMLDKELESLEQEINNLGIYSDNPVSATDSGGEASATSTTGGEGDPQSPKDSDGIPSTTAATESTSTTTTSGQCSPEYEAKEDATLSPIPERSCSAPSPQCNGTGQEGNEFTQLLSKILDHHSLSQGTPEEEFSPDTEFNEHVKATVLQFKTAEVTVQAIHDCCRSLPISDDVKRLCKKYMAGMESVEGAGCFGVDQVGQAQIKMEDVFVLQYLLNQCILINLE